MVREGELVAGFAEVNGAGLYYQVLGQGSPVLLLHAGVADQRMWDDQIESFAEHHRIVRFDFRGFGRSSMPPGSFSNFDDLRALLDYLEIDNAHLVGVSFGGMVAIDTALAYPDRVRSLVLGAPSVAGASPSDRLKQFWQQEEAALAAGDLAQATELNLALWVDGPRRGSEQVNPRVRQRVGEMQLAIFQMEIPDDIDEVELAPPAIGRLAELAMPVQVLVGDLDLEEKLDLADQLRDEVPHCEKVVIPGAAHMLNMEQPERFNRHVQAFLAEVT